MLAKLPRLMSYADTALATDFYRGLGPRPFYPAFRFHSKNTQGRSRRFWKSWCSLWWRNRQVLDGRLEQGGLCVGWASRLTVRFQAVGLCRFVQGAYPFGAHTRDWLQALLTNCTQKRAAAAARRNVMSSRITTSWQIRMIIWLP